MRATRKIVSCYKPGSKYGELYVRLKNAPDNEVSQILFGAFHKVLTNVPTDEIDEFMDSCIEKVQAKGTLAEKIILHIVGTEKEFRKIHTRKEVCLV